MKKSSIILESCQEFFDPHCKYLQRSNIPWLLQVKGARIHASYDVKNSSSPSSKSQVKKIVCYPGITDHDFTLNIKYSIDDIYNKNKKVFEKPEVST